jgi:hypothetical protein
MLMILLAGCQTAYYATMEKLGYHKRDILVGRVQETRTSQEEAKAQFQSALEHFRTVIQVRGGELEAKYNQLKAELDTSETRANAVHERIAAVEEVAQALFNEWEAELAQYSNAALRRASAQQLAQTRQRYTPFLAAMRRAEAKMEPVLAVFRDQVLFLKHNLNAQAIAGLQQEARTVEANIAALIRDMDAAIAEANTFLKTLEQG